MQSTEKNVKPLLACDPSVIDDYVMDSKANAVWINVGNVLVHLIQGEEGVRVNLRGQKQSPESPPLAETSLTYKDASLA